MEMGWITTESVTKLGCTSRLVPFPLRCSLSGECSPFMRVRSWDIDGWSRRAGAEAVANDNWSWDGLLADSRRGGVPLGESGSSVLKPEVVLGREVCCGSNNSSIDPLALAFRKGLLLSSALRRSVSGDNVALLIFWWLEPASEGIATLIARGENMPSVIEAESSLSWRAFACSIAILCSQAVLLR